MTKHIYGIIGANYGDEGKGRTTDFLSKKHSSNTIVVCTNGSSQRGHTVINNNIRHVFHHFGSGTLAGADTYFSKDFIVNPCMYESERAELLKKRDFTPKCFVNEHCKVALVYDMITNQVIELSRTNKHGSCGCGVWETIQRYSLMPSLNIKEIANLSETELRDYLSKCREYSHKRVIDILQSEKLSMDIYNEYVSLYQDPDLLNAMFYSIRFFLNTTIMVSDSSFLNSYDTVIFENGQGLLLDYRIDEKLSTPSITGVESIVNVINDNFSVLDIPIKLYYVTRTYITRHGSSDFKEKCNQEEINPELIDETNQPNQFQGSLMFGKLNYDELYNRIKKDIASVDFPVEYGLSVTHIKDYPWQEKRCPIGNLWLEFD